jgi:DNA-binding NarL/FixJ family response regulator
MREAQYIGSFPMDTKIAVAPALVLADDNPALLSNLVQMLQAEYKVVAAFPNGTSVLDNVALLQPDIVILDISLGDMTGFEVARRLQRDCCSAKIIFLTVHEDMDFVNAAFDIGACGYVFKSRVSEDLIRAISTVFGGGRFASSTPSVN